MTKLLLRYKASLSIKNKKQLTPLEIATNDEILNLMTKAKRFEIITKLSFNKPSKAQLEAESILFRAAEEDSN